MRWVRQQTRELWGLKTLAKKPGAAIAPGKQGHWLWLAAVRQRHDSWGGLGRGPVTGAAWPAARRAPQASLSDWHIPESERESDSPGTSGVSRRGQAMLCEGLVFAKVFLTLH